MGLFFGGVPDWLVAWASTTGLHAAVETGTYKGDSADLLARTFGRCSTIELQPELAERARQRFADRSEVAVLEGSSRDHLGAALTEPSFVWLDAHWSAGGTAGEDDPCPLLDELSTIRASGHEHVVAVDDLRLFGMPEAGWPGIAEVVAAMPGTVFAVDDVLVGVPPGLAASFPTSGFRQETMLFRVWDQVEQLRPAPPPLVARMKRRAAVALRR